MPQILHISHRSCYAAAPAAGPLRPGAHARARAGSRLHARAGAPLTMAEPHPPKAPTPRRAPTTYAFARGAPPARTTALSLMIACTHTG